MANENQIVEADHSSGLLDILALTQSGTWEPIATVAINEPEIINRYRTPLLLRFGYSQAVQSDMPHEVGDVRGVIPQDNLPEQSKRINPESTGSGNSSM
jgi:hypothetical protein